MFKIILFATVGLLSACSTHQINDSQPLKTNPDRRIQQFQNNIYYTQQLSKDSDLWNESPNTVKHVTFSQLTSSEKMIYQRIVSIRLNQSIVCEDKEFLFTGYKAFPFFEVMDYKARVELQSTQINLEDQAKGIIWRGKVRIGFDHSLARDVVPYQPYTFLKDNPDRSLPNFRSFTTYNDIWLTEDHKIFEKDSSKNITEELVIIPPQYDCTHVKVILDTLTPEEDDEFLDLSLYKF